jgi:hypothetical protein
VNDAYWMIEAVVGRADRRRVIALFWSQIDADLYWDAMVTVGRFRRAWKVSGQTSGRRSVLDEFDRRNQLGRASAGTSTRKTPSTSAKSRVRHTANA